MSNPTSILPAGAIGFARDYAMDDMPRGLLWDLADYIPNRRGAKLEGRGPWSYFTTTATNGQIWGGFHAPYTLGTKLLIGSVTGRLYNVDLTTGAITDIGAVSIGLRNGSMLRDRVYFADATQATVPKYVTFGGGTSFGINPISSTAPKASLLGVYKDRLIAGLAPPQAAIPGSGPSYLYFSPLETDGGPLGAWDVKSFIGTSRAITGIYPMTSQILVFHDGSIEKIRGSIPPGTNIDTDMYLDAFSEQIGCSDPASIVPWQENVIFANPQGVYLTDGATIRSLTEQGGISDLWRQLYATRRSGTYVRATVFLDKLFVSVLTNWNASTPDESRPMTLVCDLTSRAWSRLKNVHAYAFIDSSVGTEEVWWAVDTWVAALGQARLSKLSPMYFGPEEFDPDNPSPVAPDAYDGNGLAVLPNIKTGWHRLGPEGVKRLRHIYVSHMTQAQNKTKADVLEVGGRLSPFPNLSPMSVGKLSANPRYKRSRLRLDRRGYGVQVEVRQVLPTYLSRIYDISIDQWPQDRAHL